MQTVLGLIDVNAGNDAVADAEMVERFTRDVDRLHPGSPRSANKASAAAVITAVGAQLGAVAQGLDEKRGFLGRV